jgi:hypothetical protein|tara:strand:- start:307 stop:648 length:342 start_codon:yes stop_codon:yes gene_type:complete
MNIEDNIKKWVVLDNKHKNLNNEIKLLRDEKNNITQNLVNEFERKSVKFPTINISDGKLSLINTKIGNVISYNFLLECFNDFFKDEVQANELLDFIKSRRTYNNVSNIKRIYK